MIFTSRAAAIPRTGSPLFLVVSYPDDDDDEEVIRTERAVAVGIALLYERRSP